LVADIGTPCPPDLPAHAHADCLSFELAADGERVIENSGTSTYTAGPTRSYERSTRAHNTVEIDGTDQTEVWGAFRAARLAKPTLHHHGDNGTVIEVRASHDGYRRLRGSPVHTRTWSVTADKVQIVDQIHGRGDHRIMARLHIPGPARERSDGSIVAGGVVISCEGSPGMTRRLVSSELARGFGRRYRGNAVECIIGGPLPIAIQTRLQLEEALEDGSHSHLR
jgi:hypothetical protein